MSDGTGTGMRAATEASGAAAEAGEVVTVPASHQGYPGIAFGGYVAGLLAARAAADTVRVDFRAATPVDTPLRVTGLDHGGAQLSDGTGAVFATATPVPGLSVSAAPDAPSWDQAAAAAEAFRTAGPTGLAADGTVVDCFGCGPRPPGRGLRQCCMPVPGRDVVATAWTAHPAFADARGLMRAELLWAVLDCPTAWAGVHAGRLRPGAVTASLTATLLRPVAAGEDLITYAWPIATQGRKHTMGAVVTTERGEPCAVGEALWIDPRRESGVRGN
ncbi:PaaI family thioesterase [Streptomyces venezuelae]|uniref:PaaI family thioesterase n=1 Tax=Streptomyces venezuelae TaxID=54571 RepID=UPI00379B6638